MYIQEPTVKISLTKGYVALIDAEHAHLVQDLKWCKSSDGYARRTVPTTYRRSITIMMHSVLWEAINGPIPKGFEIDHINGDKLDNRIENLRLATHRQNSQNHKKRRDGETTSKFVGVSWDKQRNRWRASVKVSGKAYYIGLFDSEEEASGAYQKALTSPILNRSTIA